LTLCVDQFLLSSDLSVHYWPIVANTFIRKLTLQIHLKVFSSLSDELEIDLELWPVIWGQIFVADPQAKKLVTEKRSIFTGEKISLLALYTTFLEPGWGLPVKSCRIDRKINFFLIFEEQKKSYFLKWPKIISLQDSTLKPIFYFWNSLFQIVMASGLKRVFLEVKNFEILITESCVGERKKRANLSYREKFISRKN
jgi:hypothetical protein